MEIPDPASISDDSHVEKACPNSVDDSSSNLDRAMEGDLAKGARVHSAIRPDPSACSNQPDRPGVETALTPRTQRSLYKNVDDDASLRGPNPLPTPGPTAEPTGNVLTTMVGNLLSRFRSNLHSGNVDASFADSLANPSGRLPQSEISLDILRVEGR